MNKETIILLLPYFNYLFDPIDWDYKQLTSLEKQVISEEMFNNIKRIKTYE